MAGINKNFVVKNGLEVRSNLILADSQKDSVGIGTSNINYKLHVRGGIGATDVVVTGVATVPYLHLTGSVSAGSSLGAIGQFLVRAGTGVTWQNLQSIRTSATATASPGQTSFSFTYTLGLLDVYVNGVKLNPSEYTASDGITIILNQPCFGDESLEFISYMSSNPGYAFTGIYGISVSEEGSYVGNPGGVVALNFVGSAVTAIGSGAGVTVYVNNSPNGIVTAQNGFTSGIGVTDPVQITVSGNVLTFNVVGVGSTSLTLY